MDIQTLSLRVSRCENLPVLSQVVSQVLKLADDPDSSPRQMENIIARDPALTAKILRVANSPFYGLNHVPSISRAIGVLGLNAIKSLVIAVAYQQIMGGRSMAARFNKVSFWRHSLATAVAARILAKLKCPGKADELYAAAMMHDVGLQVMDKFCPIDLDQAIIMAQKEGMALHIAEKYVMGFDHCMVGSILAERWGLPKMMKHAIQFHHEPFDDPDCAPTTVYIAAANVLAHQAGYRNNAETAPIEDGAEYFEAVGIAMEQLEAIREVMVSEIAKAEEGFQIK